MRLATLVVAASMLLAVGPAVANHEIVITSDDPYNDEIEIDDDAYVKPGWWQGEDDVPADGGFAVDLDGLDSSGEDRQVHWLWIFDPDSDDVTTPAVIDVEAEGGVVAAMDIFKIRQNDPHHEGSGTAMTPNCPQQFAEELYPGEERFSWAFRVLSETTQFHQRAALNGSMSATLVMDHAPEGYLVAIYPQAASANEAVESATGETNISYQVSFSDDDDELNVRIDQDGKAPDRPFHTNEWVGVGKIGPTVECVDRGLVLPDELSEATSIEELPGPGPADEQVVSLLETNLAP